MSNEIVQDCRGLILRNINNKYEIASMRFTKFFNYGQEQAAKLEFPCEASQKIDGSLIGTSPRITIGMLEVRGIGIIDISSLYGLSSILPSKDINLLMHFEHWKDDGDYDRLGIDKETQDILGVKVRRLRVPVRPGRNIAVIIEAAAGNYRHSLMSDVTPVDIIEQRMCEIGEEE